MRKISMKCVTKFYQNFIKLKITDNISTKTKENVKKIYARRKFKKL